MRDLVSWMRDMCALLLTEEPARSVTEVEGLLTKHNEHRAEMDAREESVAMVTKGGRKLTQQGHYASTEVSVDITQTQDITHTHTPTHTPHTHAHTHTHRYVVD